MRRKEVGGDGLADRMHEAMEAAGLSQVEVARRMGKDAPQQVSDWLRGRKRPGATNLRLFADAVGVSVDDLLGVRGPMASEKVVEATEGLAQGLSPAEALRRAGIPPTAEAVAAGDELLQAAQEWLRERWASMTPEEKRDLARWLASPAGRRGPSPGG